MSGAYKPDVVALDRYLKGPNGDIGRDVQRRTRNVQLRGKELVGKRTHELERNIVTRPVVSDSRGLVGRVVAGEQLPDARAVWNHDGTAPHVIVPRTPGGVLAFTVQGRKVFARRVRHPGTKATQFLTRALPEARR